jgi:hypothetical protein
LPKLPFAKDEVAHGKSQNSSNAATQQSNIATLQHRSRCQESAKLMLQARGNMG